jgi:hypothetical protein
MPESLALAELVLPPFLTRLYVPLSTFYHPFNISNGFVAP